MRAFLTAFFIILWLILGWFYYQSYHDCCHGDDTRGERSQETSTTSDAASSGSADNKAKIGMSDYLMFNYSDGEPVLRADWDTYRNSLISGMSDGDNLEITGLYRSDEVNNTTFENLGLARASQIKDLFSPPLDESKITLKSQLVDDNAKEGDLLLSSNIRKYRKSANIDETIADKTIIRFPSNSIRKLDDSEVEEYLDKVAERVKASGERVRLTGHTDRLGSIESNLTLGQRRADIIKRYLLSKGVSADKIITLSKGESSPVASNNDAAGRAKNRRAELEIIK